MTPEELKERQREELAARQLSADEDLRAVLKTREGRRFLWSLIDGRCGVHAPSFAGEHTHQTAHNEGRRRVGQELLLECLRVAPSDYVVMVEEAVSRQQEELLKREMLDGRK